MSKQARSGATRKAPAIGHLSYQEIELAAASLRTWIKAAGGKQALQAFDALQNAQLFESNWRGYADRDIAPRALVAMGQIRQELKRAGGWLAQQVAGSSAGAGG